MTRSLVFAALALIILWPLFAFGADDSPDLASFGGWAELALRVGVSTAGLGLVIYWILVHHLPTLSATFSASLAAIVADHAARRAEDREYHERAIQAINAAIEAEGEKNRTHREAQTTELRDALTGLGHDAPPTRRRTGAG